MTQTPGANWLETMEWLQRTSLGYPSSWTHTTVFAVAGLAVLLLCSPGADWLASRVVKRPPDLKAFRALQQSWVKLLIGIVIAWVLGGFVEEVLLRGVVLRGVERLLDARLAAPWPAAGGVLAAAAIAWVAHLYQGPRAALIIAQLSVLFGVIYLISGHDLWSVILAHGLYDTIAFVRFALRRSKYSGLDASSD